MFHVEYYSKVGKNDQKSGHFEVKVGKNSHFRRVNETKCHTHTYYYIKTGKNVVFWEI